jgi:hypothetical protein
MKKQYVEVRNDLVTSSTLDGQSWSFGASKQYPFLQLFSSLMDASQSPLTNVIVILKIVTSEFP